MDSEMTRTIFVPICTIAVFLVGWAAIVRFKRWRKRRMMERGIFDLANRVRGAGKSKKE
jgi:hypothetical protein